MDGAGLLKGRQRFNEPAHDGGCSRGTPREQADRTSERFKDHGLFPEFVFFDCNACHHPMTPPRWSRPPPR